MTDTASLIQKSSLGEELSAEEAAILDTLLTRHTIAADEFLITEGTADETLHVLLSGKLEVVKRTSADEESTLAVLREGDLAGELSFIDGHQHSVGLRALVECEVLSLKRDDFESIIETHPHLVYKVMRALARSTRRKVHRMNSEFIELNNYIFKQHGRY